MRVSDYIMNCLSESGVRHVFQVTGRGALFLSDALAKHAELSAVSLHHEQSCAYAAISNAEQTGGLGACLISTGCASTNAITGVLSAWQDGVPCVFVSGQNVLNETSRYTGLPLRTFGQQEADIVSLVSSITKYAKMLTKPEEIVEVMHRAISLACTGRKGPVWVDVPLDLQSALINPDKIDVPNTLPEYETSLGIEEMVSQIAKDLASAKRPVVLIGRGVRSSGAEDKLKSFIEKWKIPLTYSTSAPDTYGTQQFPLSIGSVGAMACSRAANFAVANSDYVLVLGSRLTPITTGNDFCKFARDANVVVVDIDPVEHEKESIRIDQFLESDLSNFFDLINGMEAKQTELGWIDKCNHWKTIFQGIEKNFDSPDLVDLYQLSDVLSDMLPKPSTLITDSGLAEVILPSNIRFKDGINCIHPVSQGVMGFALPAAIGAQKGTTTPVLAVIGDGSIMMNLQELESIRYHKLPIKIIVINNNVYSIIRRRQHDLFRKRTIGTDPQNGVSTPKFKKVADCFGLKYIKIEGIEQLEYGLKVMFENDDAVLCEIMGRPDQSYIEIGNARSTIDKRFVRRPLEDQKPFLPRDLFLQEMLIDPIDQ